MTRKAGKPRFFTIPTAFTLRKTSAVCLEHGVPDWVSRFARQGARAVNVNVEVKRRVTFGQKLGYAFKLKYGCSVHLFKTARHFVD